MPGFMSRMLFVMVLMGFVAVRFVYRRHREGERQAVRPGRERLLTRAMTASVAIPAVLWLGSPLLGFAQAPLPEWVNWLGYLTALVGVGLLAWAHATLGRNFSPWLEIRGDHTLITGGPYRWVRHPIYSAGALLVLGSGLLTGNLLVLACPTTALAMLLWVRLPDEEAMLRRTFGTEYDAWATGTGRLLPKLGGPPR